MIRILGFLPIKKSSIHFLFKNAFYLRDIGLYAAFKAEFWRVRKAFFIVFARLRVKLIGFNKGIWDKFILKFRFKLFLKYIYYVSKASSLERTDIINATFCFKCG